MINANHLKASSLGYAVKKIRNKFIASVYDYMSTHSKFVFVLELIPIYLTIVFFYCLFFSYVCAYPCTYMQRPEVDTGCIPPSITT